MRDERGHSLSSFVAVTVVALLLVAGLVVDGGAQVHAARRAELAASAAARAAAAQTATNRLAGVALDAGAATAAAQRALAGHPGVTGEVTFTGQGVVRVRTRTSVETVFLSLIGVHSLSASGSAEARLTTG